MKYAQLNGFKKLFLATNFVDMLNHFESQKIKIKIKTEIEKEFLCEHIYLIYLRVFSLSDRMPTKIK